MDASRDHALRQGRHAEGHRRAMEVIRSRKQECTSTEICAPQNTLGETANSQRAEGHDQDTQESQSYQGHRAKGEFNLGPKRGTDCG